ncbi:hypothetical protein, partial [Burkholderia ubonensis]|uniref:hypothetical protein n=1 Tax=Burkholderia ubonensis TaxID=101571 RepID=UPI001E4D9BB4
WNSIHPCLRFSILRNVGFHFFRPASDNLQRHVKGDKSLEQNQSSKGLTCNALIEGCYELCR